MLKLAKKGYHHLEMQKKKCFWSIYALFSLLFKKKGYHHLELMTS